MFAVRITLCAHYQHGVLGDQACAVGGVGMCASKQSPLSCRYFLAVCLSPQAYTFARETRAAAPYRSLWVLNLAIRIWLLILVFWFLTCDLKKVCNKLANVSNCSQPIPSVATYRKRLQKSRSCFLTFCCLQRLFACGNGKPLGFISSANRVHEAARIRSFWWHGTETLAWDRWHLTILAHPPNQMPGCLRPLTDTRVWVGQEVVFVLNSKVFCLKASLS